MVVDSAAQAANPNRKRRALLISTVTVAALLLVSLGGLGWLVLKPTAHEVVLQPAGFVTESPFAADPFAGAPDPKLAKPAEDIAKLPNAPMNSQTTTATDVAIYGGSGSHTVCDATKFLQFMGKSPAQAQAWVDALNADSQLNWPNGALTVTDISAYVQTLAPVVLMTDTLVTNHDFVNGKPVAYTSVLQAGTAVLADMWGVPRLQCYCGNPLTLPPGVTTVTYTGKSWPGFDPGNVTLLQPPTKPVAQLTVQDLNNPGGTLTIAPGSSTAQQPGGTTQQPGSTAQQPGNTTQSSGFYKKVNPPTPSADICSGEVGNNIKTVPGDFQFTATNNSPVEVDLWSTQMTWQALPGEDPAYGGDIDSCQMTYIGTLPKGASDSTLLSGAFQKWAAFEGAQGTGPVSAHINKGDGATWSIQ